MKLFTKRLAVLGGVLALSATLAACGSDSKPAAKDSTTVAATTPTLPPSTTTTSPPSPYKATVTPTEGLKGTEAISVKISNFKPGLQLGINLCAQKGTADAGVNDCAIDHIVLLKVGADGTGTGTFQLGAWLFGSVGAAKHNCKDPDTQCLLSVGELRDGNDVQRSDPVFLKFA